MITGVRNLIHPGMIAAAALALVLSSAIATAQTAYRYRDANGHWVFTDRAPSPPRPAIPSLSGTRAARFMSRSDRSDEAGIDAAGRVK